MDGVPPQPTDLVGRCEPGETSHVGLPAEETFPQVGRHVPPVLPAGHPGCVPFSSASPPAFEETLSAETDSHEGIGRVAPFPLRLVGGLRAGRKGENLQISADGVVSFQAPVPAPDHSHGEGDVPVGREDHFPVPALPVPGKGCGRVPAAHVLEAPAEGSSLDPPVSRVQGLPAVSVVGRIGPLERVDHHLARGGAGFLRPRGRTGKRPGQEEGKKERRGSRKNMHGLGLPAPFRFPVSGPR